MSTKSDILAVLEAERSRHISGQELANSLGLTRTAVWKAIKTLEAQGHKICAVPNKGYKLTEESDVLSPESVLQFLPEPMRGNQIITYKTLDSTNTELKRLALDGAAHGTILLAEEQTQGRGRGGKSFFSPYGTGLYMSVLLRPNKKSDTQMITIGAAVAVSKAIEEQTGKPAEIKWVNDIYLGGRKVCGILTEAATDFESGGIESIVVGIGINCTAPAEGFPEELSFSAGSLDSSGLLRSRLAAAIAREIIEGFEAGYENRNLIDEYRSRSILTGKTISFQKEDKTLSGKVMGIDDSGGLMLELEGGEKLTLHSGEVSLGYIKPDKA
ncbi:MAG: biotin--[acetyl-CoA-carboxylase] ligase [Clostridiales bacterium]|nr:biotin--[acetyl-CoA-carboxylase] ligase [Clostridiales bacterium]